MSGFYQQLARSGTGERSETGGVARFSQLNFKPWTSNFGSRESSFACQSRLSRLSCWLVVWGFDNMILESGAALCEQPIGQHFSRPFNGEVSGEDPHIGRGPHGTMIFRKFRIK